MLIMVRAAASWHARDGTGPVGCFGLTISLAAQIGRNLLETDAMTGQKGAIVQFFGQQRVRHGQQQGRVGAGSDGDPVHRAAGVDVVTHWTDVDEAHARLGHAPQAGRHGVFGCTAGCDLGVLGWHAPKTDEQLGMLGHHPPTGVQGEQLIHRRDDVRHQHARSAQAVCVRMAYVATDAVEKTVDLALGVMKAPCAGPAVGAAENGFGAVWVASHQVQCFVPLHLDKGILSTQVARCLR